LYELRLSRFNSRFADRRITQLEAPIAEDGKKP
jgi:hypothetical protein